MSKNRTVWVVDDVPEVYFLFEPLIRKTDMRVVYAGHANEVDAKHGDIVFMDLNGTGSQEYSAPEGVTVLYMTGSFKKADLQKPFTNKELVNVLRKNIHKLPSAS